MAKAARFANSTICVMRFAAVGWLLGLRLHLYHLQEVLICWLFFSLVFVSLALLILAGALACYAGECVIAWASKAARETPKVVLGPPAIQLKTIPADGKLK
jgi:hypothetical protein